MKRAWRILFGGFSLSQIISNINRIWIDPDWELTIKKGFVIAISQERETQEDSMVA